VKDLRRILMLKNIIIIFIAFLITYSLQAQEKKTNVIPDKLKEAVTKLYPNANEIKWNKEGKNFEAEFLNNGVKTSVNLDNDGNIVETETAIKRADFPNGVIDFIKKHYKGYTITEKTKIVNSQGVKTYEVEITKNKIKKDLHFDNNGNLIN